MRMFTYSEACQNLSELLNIAVNEEVEIRRQDGTIFLLTSKKNKAKSPFNIPGIKTKVTSEDILNAVRDSRMG